MTILLVEANPAHLHQLADMIYNLGVEDVMRADSAFEAMRIVTRQKPILIIVNIDLAMIDGYHLAYMMKLEPEYASIPLVAITSYSTNLVYREALEAGFETVIERQYLRNYLINQLPTQAL